jgi:hypothetical protein
MRAQARGNGRERRMTGGTGAQERERRERLSGWVTYNFLFNLIENLQGHLCLFTTYLTPLTSVGVNFCFIFKLQGKIIKLKNREGKITIRV